MRLQELGVIEVLLIRGWQINNLRLAEEQRRELSAAEAGGHSAVSPQEVELEEPFVSTRGGGGSGCVTPNVEAEEGEKLRVNPTACIFPFAFSLFLFFNPPRKCLCLSVFHWASSVITCER